MAFLTRVREFRFNCVISFLVQAPLASRRRSKEQKALLNQWKSMYGGKTSTHR